MMSSMLSLLLLGVCFTMSQVRSCEVIFNATFDQEIKDNQRSSYIGRDPYNAISIANTLGAVGGGAARVNNGSMVIWFLAGNDLSAVFQIELSFKLDSALASLSQKVTLFSNDCNNDNASLILDYTPSTNSYQVFVRDTGNSVTLQCRANQNNNNGFHAVSLEYKTGALALKVDGATLCESNVLSGKLAITTCPMYLVGDPLKVNRNVEGYLDEFIVRRYCVV